MFPADLDLLEITQQGRDTAHSRPQIPALDDPLLLPSPVKRIIPSARASPQTDGPGALTEATQEQKTALAMAAQESGTKSTARDDFVSTAKDPEGFSSYSLHADELQMGELMMADIEQGQSTSLQLPSIRANMRSWSRQRSLSSVIEYVSCDIVHDSVVVLYLDLHFPNSASP